MNKKIYQAPEAEMYRFQANVQMLIGSKVNPNQTVDASQAMTKERGGILDGEDFDWDMDF